MHSMTLSLLLILLSIFTLQAQASILETHAARFFYDGNRSFLSHRVLGANCSGFRSLRTEIPCNPSLITLRDESEQITYFEDSLFGLNVFFGDDYETLYKNRELLKSEDKLLLAQSLLGEPDAVRFQGSGLVWLRMPYFVVWYQPLRWTYFSNVQNPAYPMISVHAMQESNLAAAWGGVLDKNLKMGVQFRYFERTFVHEEFLLFDAIPEIENYFQSKKQKGFLIEPGFSYNVEETSDLIRFWKPMLSFNMTNLGWVDNKYEFAPMKPIGDLGLSVSPKAPVGELEFGLNYRVIGPIEKHRTARVGAQYRLGVASALLAYEVDQWSAGLSSAYKNISAGIMYERNKISDSLGEKNHQDSVSVEFRFIL